MRNHANQNVQFLFFKIINSRIESEVILIQHICKHTKKWNKKCPSLINI